MLFVKNSTNYLGVEILGDSQDFHALYKALHIIIGEEKEFRGYEMARIRILGICYDIRHAIEGDYEYTFVENGINSEILKEKGFIAPEKNVYLKINILWPELLFIQIILNNFLILYAKKNASDTSEVILDRKNIWDENIAQVRLFQSVVSECIKDTIPEVTYKRMLGYVLSKEDELKDYLPHYVDMLNLKFINMDREQRIKHISIMARRIVERGKEYQAMIEDLETVVRDHNCPVENIKINLNYPAELEW